MYHWFRLLVPQTQMHDSEIHLVPLDISVSASEVDENLALHVKMTGKLMISRK